MSSDESLDVGSALGIVHQNVDAIAALQNAESLSVSTHQKSLERLVMALSVPACLFGILGVIALWIAINMGLKLVGREAWDPPPFGGLQTAISIVALVISSLIIITQSRQGKVAERNAHLDLQVNLLVDQKVTKVIQLLEEIRADSPMLRNRRDVEAEELQVAVDPTHVASVIAEKLSSESALEAAEPG